ncbi:MAG TPA: hypothetical protein VFJ19_01420 [Nocardioidaceae bacterium]|nr:hypothetical protein [Nocardioidaceae bacterium]
MKTIGTVEFTPPAVAASDGAHHARAAAGNTAVTNEAAGMLRDALSGTAHIRRILLKAAAGAGKSYVLRQLVADAVAHPRCARVVVTAFTNRQVHPLAARIGNVLGRDRVCLFVAEDRYADVPVEAHANATVVTGMSGIPHAADVVIATTDKLSGWGGSGIKKLLDHLGPARNGQSPFDVLFVDEAWQLPHHKFDKIEAAAPITVGVGDVGQLPPFETGANPWRGDPGYNPYRAWPTSIADDNTTWSEELPAVWRPAAGHLGLWRTFYPEWAALDCVAAPADRALALNGMRGAPAAIWRQVGTAVPTLLEVEGLPPAEAADVDLPLMETVEWLLDRLFTRTFALEQRVYDAAGTPTRKTLTRRPATKRRSGDDPGDPLVAILATRNQAVDDAETVVGRLRDKHGLTEADIVSSTVDSYQGQTNGVTVAVHPLSGAAALDEFNSAFGRLAVTCTRATHGLLMVTRPGLDQLLGEAPARPGTPYGEPGNRHLPRQTHQRILATFARGRLSVQ